jgi:GNAT superfamily N-acetyltransferase
VITHYLGRDEVAAYCRDFADRLVALGSDFPRFWFPIGESGVKIAEEVYHILPEDYKSSIVITTVYCERNSGVVNYEDDLSDVTFDNATVLLIDSAVHSGHTMKKAADDLWKRNCLNIITYTLMLKATSGLVPNYFGVVVAERDRVYFQLDSMPNNRLSNRAPFGILRLIQLEDVNRDIGDIGEPFGSDLKIGDFLYDRATRGYHPYIYEHNNQIAGIVVFGKNRNTLFIDLWATVLRYRGKGVGNATLRWAETWARSRKCEFIELYAYSKAIPIYEHYNYMKMKGKDIDLGNSQKYSLMRKRILHTFKSVYD